MMHNLTYKAQLSQNQQLANRGCHWCIFTPYPMHSHPPRDPLSIEKWAFQ